MQRFCEPDRLNAESLVIRRLITIYV